MFTNITSLFVSGGDGESSMVGNVVGNFHNTQISVSIRVIYCLLHSL